MVGIESSDLKLVCLAKGLLYIERAIARTYQRILEVQPVGVTSRLMLGMARVGSCLGWSCPEVSTG